MSEFYDSLKGTVSDLMTTFEQGTVVYTPVTSGTNEWDPVTEGTPVNVKATVKGVSAKYIDDFISASDLEVLIEPFGQPVTQQGQLSIDGVNKSIIRISPIPAAGDTLVWKVFVKG